jgi:hydroxymethylpyrimidine pyrophosphatase-like HAD family hydrolase
MTAPTYRALATDYDGTIASDGHVDDATVHALERARAFGLRLVLVTGRAASDLSNTFAHISLFDRVVAENGAVILDPSTSTLRTLAPAPPSTLVESLSRLNVPMSVGHSIIATVEPHEHQVLAVIRELGLDWHITFNKGSVMALPSGVTKATGLSAALQELELSADRTVGIGDAENDQAFLAVCRLAVAVANALPSVKDMADIVTVGERGAGVAELIERLCTNQLDDLPTDRRRRTSR